jgi:hypothetical protein
MARPSEERMRAAKILGVDPTNLSDEEAQAALKKNLVPKENIRIRAALRDVKGDKGLGQ